MGGPGSGRKPPPRGHPPLTNYFQPKIKREASLQWETKEVDVESDEENDEILMGEKDMDEDGDEGEDEEYMEESEDDESDILEAATNKGKRLSARFVKDNVEQGIVPQGYRHEWESQSFKDRVLKKGSIVYAPFPGYSPNDEGRLPKNISLHLCF